MLIKEKEMQSLLKGLIIQMAYSIGKVVSMVNSGNLKLVIDQHCNRQAKFIYTLGF